MFDPTIYENIKVVVEGAVYDLDLAGVILITNRIDRIELSTMSRYFALRFEEKEKVQVPFKAEIQLYAGLEDLSAEILELKEKNPGCLLQVCFYLTVQDIEEECRAIQKILEGIWQNRPRIHQILSFEYGDKNQQYQNKIILDFERKINEEHIEDVHTVIDLTLHSLKTLNQQGYKSID